MVISQGRGEAKTRDVMELEGSYVKAIIAHDIKLIHRVS